MVQIVTKAEEIRALKNQTQQDKKNVINKNTEEVRKEVERSQVERAELMKKTANVT